jgi:hypothetical protein
MDPRLAEIMFYAQKREKPAARTDLQECLDSGHVAAFAPMRLAEEVEEHLPRLREERGVSQKRW